MKKEEYTRRTEDNGFHVPGWAAPVVLSFFVIGFGVYMKSTAADESRVIVKEYSDVTDPRLDSLEATKHYHATQIELLKNDQRYTRAALQAIATQVGAAIPALPDG